MVKLNRGRSVLLAILFCCFFGINSYAESSENGSDELTLTIGTESAKMGEEMCVDVMTCNFALIGFQFTISWDEEIVAFSRVEKPSIPFFLQSSFQEFPSMFRVAWINENITSEVALADSTPVFTLCFIPKQIGTTALIFDSSSSTPLHPEFIGLNGLEEAVLLPGSITVLGCSATTNTIEEEICIGSTYEGYTQSGQYTDVFTSHLGCDSTRILNLTVRPTILNTSAVTICEGENFGGRTLEGTYMDTYQSVLNGCDSVQTILLSVLANTQTTINRTICSGSCLTLNGVDYCASGAYSTNLTGSSGCDSIVVYNLTVSDQMSGNAAIELCPGEVWTENGSTYNQAGVYTFNYTSSAGCDSTHTLTLSFLEEDIATTEQVAICQGANFGGRTQAGIYRDTYQNRFGCDSTHTIELSVLDIVEATVAVSICRGQTYNGYSTSGEYRTLHTTAAGCDSINVLNLTVDEAIRTTINESICDGQAVNGYTQSGQYEDTFISQSGCDSIRTLNLSVANSIETLIETKICQGSQFEGYSTSGIYQEVFTTVNGCDSMRTLNLTVASIIESTIEVNICEGENYEGFTRTGNYLNLFQSVDGCDSLRTLKLRVSAISETAITTSICEGENFEGYTSGGVYTNIFVNQDGCDSIRILNLNILAADDMACATTPTINISPIAALNYYPNPVSTTLYLEWTADREATYSVLDVSGKILLSEKPLLATTTADLADLSKGIYYLKIAVEGERTAYYGKLLKL